MQLQKRLVLIGYVVAVVAALVWVPWSATVNDRTFRLPYGLVWSGPHPASLPATLPADFDFSAADAAAKRADKLALYARPDFSRIALNVAVVSGIALIALLLLPVPRRS